jgi:hypothetical protein
LGPVAHVIVWIEVLTGEIVEPGRDCPGQLEEVDVCAKLEHFCGTVNAYAPDAMAMASPTLTCGIHRSQSPSFSFCISLRENFLWTGLSLHLPTLLLLVVLSSNLIYIFSCLGLGWPVESSCTSTILPTSMEEDGARALQGYRPLHHR